MCSSLDVVVFGSWFDHVIGWWEKKQSNPEIHYMFFEDMVEVSSVCVRTAVLHQGFQR